MTTKIHSFDDFLGKLQKVKQLGNGQYQALCPGHDDRKESLSVKEADSRILLTCFAGCELDDILKPLGLESKDLFLNSPKPKLEYREIEAVYHYTDENSEPFEVVRTRPKGFYQRRPNKKGTGYIYDMKGNKPTLYHRDELQPAIDTGEPIYVVEGEKDTDRLCSLGLAATTNPMGAGKWRDSYSETLRDSDLVIIPDNDDAGRKHATQVAESCYGKAQRVRVLELPAKDVSDWLNEGGDIQQLEELVSQCPDYRPPPSADYTSAFRADEIKLYRIGYDPDDPRYELRDTRQNKRYPDINLPGNTYLSVERVRSRIFHTCGILPFARISQQKWQDIVAKKGDEGRVVNVELPILTKGEVLRSLVLQRFEQRGEGWEVSDLRSGCYIEDKYRGPETNDEERAYWWFKLEPLKRFLTRDNTGLKIREISDALLKVGVVKKSKRIGKEETEPIWVWGVDSVKLRSSELDLTKVEKQMELKPTEQEENLTELEVNELDI